MNVKDLKEAKYNPRTITDKSLKLLEESIAKFGDLSGVVYNRRTKTLIAGHQRIKTIREKKSEIITKRHTDEHGTVESGYIEADTKSGKIRIPFRVVDWDRNTEKAANIAANAHGGKFDSEKLAILVAELEDKQFDIELTGIDELTYKNIKALEKKMQSNFKEIDIDDLNVDEDIKHQALEHICPKCGFEF